MLCSRLPLFMTKESLSLHLMVWARPKRLRSQGSQMELLEEPETGPALSHALSTDSEGPALDLEALSFISSGLDDNLPSGVSSFEELDVEEGYESGAADGKPLYPKSNEELLKVVLLNGISSCPGVNSTILTLFLARC